METGTLLPTCYRHPDRETRLACSNCARPVCVDCVRSADVGQRCLECAAPAPGADGFDGGAAPSVRGGPPVFTYAVIAICVAVSVVTLLVPSLGDRAVFAFGQINEFVAQGEWWRVLSSAFLHADVAHLAFNMWALYVLGPQLEREVGSVPFAAFYLASAIAGGAAYFFLQPGGVAVGASGAVFGLLGAWLVASYRGRKHPVGRASFQQLMLVLGLSVLMSVVPGSRIAWEAHAGGFVAGVIITTLWILPLLRRQAALRTLVAAAVAAVPLLMVV